MEDKGCYNQGATQSEFHKGKDAHAAATTTATATTRVSNHQRIAMGKPTPSKWDDAQKWLVGLSKGGGGEKSQSKNKPRNSNADDLRLIAPVPQKEQDYSSSEKEEGEEEEERSYEAETKNTIKVQSICFRDMGTEMTPIASQEPSRTATPIRATTPATRSPIHSGTSTPMRLEMDAPPSHEGSFSLSTRQCGGNGSIPCMIPEKKVVEDQGRKLTPLENRAIAWDEAERAKYMAR